MPRCLSLPHSPLNLKWIRTHFLEISVISELLQFTFSSFLFYRYLVDRKGGCIDDWVGLWVLWQRNLKYMTKTATAREYITYPNIFFSKSVEFLFKSCIAVRSSVSLSPLSLTPTFQCSLPITVPVLRLTSLCCCLSSVPSLPPSEFFAYFNASQVLHVCLRGLWSRHGDPTSCFYHCLQRDNILAISGWNMKRDFCV